jgi:hypothetical protein
MPAISSLTLNDGQVSPVAHTFAVGTTDGTQAKWLEKSAGSSLGYVALTYSARYSKSPTGADIVEIGLVQPTISETDDVISLARRSSSSVRFNFAQTATDQEKKDHVAYMINFLTAYKAYIAAVEPAY